MTPAEVAFAVETQAISGAASLFCLVAAGLSGLVAVVHVTSGARRRGRGWITVGLLTIAALALCQLAIQFWSLP